MATHAERAPRSSATPLLALVVATAVLYLAREILIPLALAVLFAFVLAPLVRQLERWRFGRIPSVLVAVLLGVGLVVGLGWLATNQAASLVGKLPEYRENIGRKLKDLRSPPTEGNLAKAAKAIEEIEREANGKGAKPKPAPKPAAEAKVSLPTTPLDLIARFGLPAALAAAALAVMVVVSTLVLVNRHDLRDRIIRLVGERRIHVTTQAMEEAAGRVSRYLLSLLLVNVTFGALLGIAFFFIGLPNALLWGLLAAVLRFVPYIGAPAAAVMPVALAFAIDDGWALVAWTVAAIAAVDVVIAYVVEPYLYGARTGLTPIAVVVGSVYWTWLWGPFGLLLATPITVCIAVATRYFPDFRFLSVILSDEPVLTPPVRFYQRLVSYEYDEAYDVADEFARQHGLAGLYDMMLIPTLQLAKRDRQRNALDPERAQYVFERTLRIVEEIADEEQARAKEKAEKAGEARGAPVPTQRVCIVAAHDEADYIAAAMLARLLASEHFEALLLPQNILAGEVPDKVAATGARVVCISSVPPQAASNAAYIAKRLRQRLPEHRVVVALWCGDENIQNTAQRLRHAGAEEVACRLSDALEKLRLVAPPGAAG